MEHILEAVEVADDRWHVVDARGRLVEASGSGVEARAFIRGYERGRHDGGALAALAVDALPARIAGGGR
jgi:hypothetical protein